MPELTHSKIIDTPSGNYELSIKTWSDSPDKIFLEISCTVDKSSMAIAVNKKKFAKAIKNILD